MTAFLKNLFALPTTRRANARLTLQQLEDRRVLSGNVMTYGNPALGYSLAINGTPYSDKVVVADLNDGGVFVQLTSGDIGKARNFYVYGHAPAFIKIEGLGGNDVIYNLTSIPSVITTGNGNDFIQGGSDRDMIFAGNGNNTVYGGAGNDIIIGGDDQDFIDAGAGNDFVQGKNGDNRIAGGPGNDYLQGGDDVDWIFGGDGNDTIHAGAGDDQLFGQAGDDHIYGEAGHDHLYGGAGNDYLSGGRDGYDDYLDGESGFDVEEAYAMPTATQSLATKLDRFIVQAIDDALSGNVNRPFTKTDPDLPANMTELERDTANATEAVNFVVPEYEPQFRDVQSAVKNEFGWFGYVAQRVKPGTTAGPGVELQAKSMTRRLASDDPLFQTTADIASEHERIAAQTQLLNMNLPPEEVDGVDAEFDQLSAVQPAELHLNPLLNADFDTTNTVAPMFGMEEYAVGTLTTEQDGTPDGTAPQYPFGTSADIGTSEAQLLEPTPTSSPDGLPPTEIASPQLSAGILTIEPNPVGWYNLGTLMTQTTATVGFQW